jgi:hypothetical protein
MLGLRWTIERHPLCSSGQPHQSTTGEASSNCSHGTPSGPIRAGSDPNIAAISTTTSGRVSASAIQNRRRMSTSSGSSAASSVGIAASSAIPHLGHVPGKSLSTPGHIGQKYAAPLLRAAASAAAADSALPWQHSCAAGAEAAGA